MTGMVDAPTLALADRLVIGYLMDALAAIPLCLSITDGVHRMAGLMPTPFTRVSVNRGVEFATAEGSETIRRLEVRPEFHLVAHRMSEVTVARRCEAHQ